MAVTRVPQDSRLVITVQNGLNVSGQPAYQQRTYKNVKASTVDADIHAIGQGMASLQKYPVTGISRVDEGNLVNM